MAPLSVIAREWQRIGLPGFGGPPAQVSLLRDLVVRREGWMEARAFEDANAACSLLGGGRFERLWPREGSAPRSASRERRCRRSRH